MMSSKPFGSPLAPIRHNGGRAPAEIEIGEVAAFDSASGTCSVITRSGRELTRCQIGTEAGVDGTGTVASLQTGAIVLVAWFPGNNEGFIVSSYMGVKRSGEAPAPTPPGDWIHRGRSGSHMLLTQGGIMDFQADPWCRLSLLPQSQTMKGNVRNFDLNFSPLSALRTIQDNETKSQAFELFVDSSFMEHDTQANADIQITFGDCVKTPNLHGSNPRSPFLHYRKVEARKSNGDPIQRTTLEEGSVDGRARRETIDNVEEGTRIVRETGSFAGGEDGPILDRMTFTMSGGSVVVQVEASGRVVITNPAFEINLDAEGRADIKNEKTSLVIDQDKIYVGGDTGAEEPIALGNKLHDRISALETWAKNHFHTHPQGPTGIPTVAPTTVPEFRSDVNFTT